VPLEKGTTEKKIRDGMYRSLSKKCGQNSRREYDCSLSIRGGSRSRTDLSKTCHRGSPQRCRNERDSKCRGYVWSKSGDRTFDRSEAKGRAGFRERNGRVPRQPGELSVTVAGLVLFSSLWRKDNCFAARGAKGVGRFVSKPNKGRFCVELLNIAIVIDQRDVLYCI